MYEQLSLDFTNKSQKKKSRFIDVDYKFTRYVIILITKNGAIMHPYGFFRTEEEAEEYAKKHCDSEYTIKSCII